jgi:ATP-dependent Clp protease ATP-binding subunit ClpA
MELANEEAKQFSHEHVETEDLLLGLIREGSGVAANVLKNLDIGLRKVRNEIEKILPSSTSTDMQGRLPLSPRVKHVLDYAMEETVLHSAAVINLQKEVMPYLVSQGVDFNAKNNEGKTALDIAYNEEAKRILREAMTGQ